MLGKVFKYEMRAAGRVLLPFYGLSLAIVAVLRFLMFLAPRVWEPAAMFVAGFGSAISMLLVVAVILTSVGYLSVRFYRSMASGEGYLTYTLPVTVDAHIGGKLIAGTLYSILGTVVAFVCGYIIARNFTGAKNSTPIMSQGGTKTGINGVYTYSVLLCGQIFRQTFV